MKNIIILTSIFISLVLFGCSMNKPSDNINEYIYNYSNSELSDREKEIFEIAKKAAIEKFGKEAWNENKPYKAELNNDVWWITGTLYHEINGKRYKNGDIGSDDKPVYLVGGTIEVKISNNTSEVLEVYHSQ